jgi:hypothetical protein
MEIENRPKDRICARREKPPQRLIQMKFDLELAEAIEDMANGQQRSFHNMIDASLRWAVWAYSQGRGPDAEMMEDCASDNPAEQRRGYSKWNEKLRKRRLLMTGDVNGKIQ